MMNSYPKSPQEANLINMIEAQKKVIRESCIRLGQAYYEAHKNDDPETMESDVKAVKDASEEILAKKALLRELRGLVLCPECNNEIPNNVVFCNYCGHRMKEDPPAPEPVPAAPQICDNCGRELRPGQKFCAGCGKPVAQMAPPIRPAVQQRICPNCGTTIADGARFCFECGTPVP